MSMAAQEAAPAEWQKGFPLDQLKALARPFKERHKPLVFGAFGLTKERDVAEALAKKRALWTGKPPEATLLFSKLKAESHQEDFAQRKFALPAGAVYCKAFAALSEAAGIKVLDALAQRANPGPVFVEVFEEDELAKLAALALGFRYATTKVSAGSEVKGIYCLRAESPLPPFPLEELATLEVLDERFLDDFDLEAVRGELAAYGDRFAQHYSDYNKRKSWTSFALRGFSDDPSFIIKPAEMSRAWKEEHATMLAERPRWTPAAEHFAKTRGVLDRLGLEFDRVRFMRLRAKDGELGRHADITDREAGLANGFLARLHIPIVTSADVRYLAWNARGHRMEKNFPEGALCYLDQRKPHSVKNQGAVDRTHLVVDCHANAKLRGMVAATQAKPAERRAA